MFFRCKQQQAPEGKPRILQGELNRLGGKIPPCHVAAPANGFMKGEQA